MRESRWIGTALLSFVMAIASATGVSQTVAHGPAAGRNSRQINMQFRLSPSLAIKPVAFKLQESPSELKLETSGYQVSVTRDGFALTVSRNGEVVLQSAGPGDAIPNLSFNSNGPQRVTALKSLSKLNGSLVLDYDTSTKDASARVELTPASDLLRVTAYLIPDIKKPVDLRPSFSFRLEPSGYWYGGGFQGFRDPQVFPLNKARIDAAGFYASSETQGTPFWYSTGGIGIWVRNPQDFAYSINRQVNGRDDGLLSVSMPGSTNLVYDIVLAGNIRDAVRRVVREIGFPRVTPPADYFRLPIYTTWVEHKTEVSQEKVLEYARAIHANKLPCGVIEIDDKWEPYYGDMQFDSRKFPDPKAMVDELHRLGYRVTLWIHPFANPDSRTFAEHQSDGLLMKTLSGKVGLIKWWNGIAAVWDFTNPRAAAEFRARLTRLQTQYGFDGFKFDGADIAFTPRDLKAYENITSSQYADVYNREVTSHFAWNEARVGIYSQPLGIVQRLIDKQSVWGNANGIEAIIPEALTVSLRGFPYVMPDMIGGNQYDNDRIDRELLVRWAQASALMPLVQFSVGPWHFDQEAVRLSREASELHIRFTPYIMKLAQEARTTGEPVIRPLWYNAPDDKETFTIMDEFMLGSDVVVAPVLKKGAASRDIYLPTGSWRDYRTGGKLEGGRWLKDYAAPLDTLPLFIREGSTAGSPARAAAFRKK